MEKRGRQWTHQEANKKWGVNRRVFITTQHSHGEREREAQNILKREIFRMRPSSIQFDLGCCKSVRLVFDNHLM